MKKNWEELGEGELIQNISYKKSIFNEKQKDHEARSGKNALVGLGEVMRKNWGRLSPKTLYMILLYKQNIFKIEKSYNHYQVQVIGKKISKNLTGSIVPPTKSLPLLKIQQQWYHMSTYDDFMIIIKLSVK